MGDRKSRGSRRFPTTICVKRKPDLPSTGPGKREAPGGGGAGRFNSILGSCRAGEGGAPPGGAASLAALYDSIWD